MTMPANPNSDTKVTQSAAITTNGEYPVILGYNTGTTAVTNTVNKASTLTYNPSTKVLTTTTFKGALSGNASSASKVNNKLTVGSKSYDGSAAVTIAASDLGLASAMLFLGTTTTAITDGATTNPVVIGGANKTVTAGNVVLYGSKEFVWTGSAWEELGNEGSYKIVQAAVADPSASGTSNTFIATISQDTNGKITATKKTVAVTNSAPTLSWGATSTIGSVAGTDLQVKMPANPNTDTKVTQTATTSNATYPLLLAPSGQTATTTTTSYFDSGVTLNPSTNTIAANISGNASTATALTTSAGSATQPIYFSNGKPVATTYTLGTSVPSGAKFTDTTYTAGTGLTLSGTNFSVTSSDASEIMNQLSEETSLAQQDDYLIAQYANGGNTTKTYHRKKVKNIITGTNVKAALGTGTETTKFLRNDGTWQVPTDSKGNDIASTYLTVDKEVPQIESQQVGHTQRTRDQNIIVAVAETNPLTLSISVDGGFTYNDYATSLTVSQSDTAKYYTVHRIETYDHTPKAEIVFYNLKINSEYRIVRFKYSSANNSLVLMTSMPDTFYYAFKFCYCPETGMAIKYNIAAEWNEAGTSATSTKEIHVYDLNGKKGAEIYSTTKTTTSLVYSSECDIGYNVVDGATSQKTYFYIFHNDMSINGTANVQHIERILITDNFSGSTTVSNSLITANTVSTNTVNEVCQVGGAFLFLGLLAAENVTDYYATARKNTIYSFVNSTYAAITLPAYLSPYSIRLRKFGDYAMVSGEDEQGRYRAFIYGYTYTATKVTEENGSSQIYNPTAFKFLYEIPVHSSIISTSGEFCPNSGLITYKGSFYDIRDGFNTKYTALYKVKLNGVKIFEYPGQ